MDIRGMILVDTAADERLPLVRVPLATLDIAGMSPLERTAERLRRYGISPVTVIVEENAVYRRRGSLPRGMVYRSTLPDRFWRVAENTFNDLAQNGAELVLVIRLGAYAEIDVEKLIQFHLEEPRRVCQAVWSAEPLDVFCVSASRRNDAASLFRSRLTGCRSECGSFAHAGYVNPLASPHDLRQFGIDILTLKTETLPVGTEIRPGIWVAPGASIEKGSRILAPAFIGSSARIGWGAVITRCTAIEHHAHVDCGTVVENSTVLPYSYVGAGLDLAHSVVRMGQIVNLRRGVTVEVADQKLLGQVSVLRAQNLLNAAARLPARIWRRLLGKTPSQQPALGEALLRPSSALGVSACDTKVAGEFASNLAVVRRYGNQ